MRRYYQLPLLFLALAAALGLFLRWQFVSPTPGIRYAWFLHSHSHVMFLGWVFNVMYLAFVGYHIPKSVHPLYLKLFLALQLLVVAMMISFPLQGYGLYSIIFSTLHTVGALVFIFIFFRHTRGVRSVSVWFARTSLIFFFISTAGPFMLGYLMSQGLGQSVWYYFSIYYYLHFQYNGFFMFGVFSLLYQLIESKGILFETRKILAFGKWMAVACVPAYALSILFARPGVLYNYIGAAAGIIQLIALAFLVQHLRVIQSQIAARFQAHSYTLLKVVFAGLVVKMVLQLASAHPDVARTAYELRPVVIAYLHLVLVGIITFFLLCWYMEMAFVAKKTALLAITLIFIGFLGSELCLIAVPWWSAVVGYRISSSLLIFVFSIFMFAGTLLFFAAFRLNRNSMQLLANQDSGQLN